jgi:DNA-binding CsgD family transcriptional regulator
MIVSVGRLLERERELRLIGGLLDRAQNGAGSVLVVEGPAGIGKTRLSRAALEEAEMRGFAGLAARGAELEREYPFGVVRQLLEPTLRAAAAEERGRLFDGAAALAGPAVLPEATLGEATIDPKFGALHGLYWLCANLADAKPLLLIVDDVQWADEVSLRFLGFLAHRIETVAVVLLVTRRTGSEVGANVADDPAAERLQLRPLSHAAVASFLRFLTADDVDEGFVAACHEATGGNPFLLDQVVKALVERDVPFTTESADLVQAVAPEAVAAAVLARLARLGSAATALARALAVLGDDTHLAAVAELVGLDESAAAEAAASLARAGVLEDSRPLRFEHPIVRSAVQAGLSAVEEAALHRRAAELLAARGASAGEITVHLLATEGSGSSWVVETLSDAAREAVARGAPGAAVPMLNRALAEPPAPELRFGLLLALGRAESALGSPEAADHLLEGHRLATDPVDRGRALLALSWSNARAQADGRPLRSLIVEAIPEVHPVDPELALELEAANTAILSYDPGAAAELGDKLERFAELDGRSIAECTLLAHLAHYRMDNGAAADEVVGMAERAVADDEIVSAAAFDAPWLLSAILVLRHADRNDAAIRTLDIALTSAERRGSIAGYALASVVRASVLLRAGDIREAEADARAGLDAAPAGTWSRLPGVGILVEVLIERGALDEAQRVLVESGADGELPDVRPATVLLLSRAALHQERGDLRAAVADLERARARLDRFGGVNIVGLDGRIRTALVKHALGDDHAAQCEAATALAAARHWGTPGAVGTALRACGLVAETGKGIELLREAAATLEGSPQKLEHARALVDLGAALRRQGERVSAREPLRRGLDLAHACGGIAVAERAREELTATGVRLRRDAQSGVDSLTPSERRIVERAATGASNREIAQALFVTVKTVEMHLGHAYRKLGVSSRNELAALITP